MNTDWYSGNSWHYKIFCVNGNTGFYLESRIFYFIHLQNECEGVAKVQHYMK